MTDKPALRALMRSLRRRHAAALGTVGTAQAAAALVQHALPHLAGFSIIGSYRAMGSELDPAPLEAALRACGCGIALPRITAPEQPLSFALWDAGDVLVDGPVSAIPQPSMHSPAVIPQAMLVPLLAADRRGFRLGQGAGYYDRTLAALKPFGPMFAVGLAHEVQIVAHVPDAPWDQPLDAIATPAQWIVCAA